MMLQVSLLQGSSFSRSMRYFLENRVASRPMSKEISREMFQAIRASKIALPFQDTDNSIPLTEVGDPGNNADPVTGHGSVAESFSIATHDVTASDYCELLNAVANISDPYELYNASMSSDENVACIQCSTINSMTSYVPIPGREKLPITDVNILCAERYCNWLQNGKPQGNEGPMTTESGAYNLSAGGLVEKSAGAVWFLPTEDQLYKATFYIGGGTNAGYYQYPNRCSEAPGNSYTDWNGNNDANYREFKRDWFEWNYYYTKSAPPYTTPTGYFQNSLSPYGLYDTAGNIFQWTMTEGAPATNNMPNFIVRGGSWDSTLPELEKTYSATYSFDTKTNTVGFRVATILKSTDVLSPLTDSPAQREHREECSGFWWIVGGIVWAIFTHGEGGDPASEPPEVAKPANPADRGGISTRYGDDNPGISGSDASDHSNGNGGDSDLHSGDGSDGHANSNRGGAASHRSHFQETPRKKVRFSDDDEKNSRARGADGAASGGHDDIPAASAPVDETPKKPSRSGDAPKTPPRQTGHPNSRSEGRGSISSEHDDIPPASNPVDETPKKPSGYGNASGEAGGEFSGGDYHKGSGFKHTPSNDKNSGDSNASGGAGGGASGSRNYQPGTPPRRPGQGGWGVDTPGRRAIQKENTNNLRRKFEKKDSNESSSIYGNSPDDNDDNSSDGPDIFRFYRP